MAEPNLILGPDADLDHQFDQLVCEVSANLEAGRPVDLDALAEAHPQHVERLRKLLPTLQAMADLGHSVTNAGQSTPQPQTGPALTTGVLGDFRILREVGRGGMGVVYEAEQISLGRRVALKVLPFAAILDPRQLQRFQNEARAAASLKHPHIVSVHSVGCERGVHYYAMEYVEGKTLAQVIEELREEQAAGSGQRVVGSGQETAHSTWSLPSHPVTPSPCHPVTPSPCHPDTPAADTKREPQAGVSTSPTTRSPEFFQRAARLGIQAAEALDHAHQMGIVHRDVKPSNLLVEFRLPSPTVRGPASLLPSPAGRGVGGEGLHLWITDFGLAMTQQDPVLTRTGDLLGTLRYMSPEQVRGSGQVVDQHTDIYSLGITLYELLTLRPAFGGGNREVILRRIAEDDPPRPRTVSRAIPKDLETIVLKATAKEPQQRYATAQELADDLKRFLADEPIRARRPTLADRAAKWARRHRPVVWSAAVSAVAVVSVLVASTILLFAGYQREKQERDAAAANAARAEENAAKAAKNYQRAREAVKQMLTRVADEQVGAIPEMKEIRRRLLEDAAAFYTELLKLNPRDAIAYFERGQVYVMLARYKEGLADFEKAVELDADNAAFHMHLGTFLRQYCCDVAYRDAKHALVHVKRAAELAPRFAYFQGELARTYAALGEPGEAKATLDRATRMAPESADDYEMIARSYNLIGDAKAALACIEKAIALDRSILDRSNWGRRTLADVLIKLGERERALAETNKAYELMLKLPFDFDHFTFVAGAFARLGEDEKALAVISKGIESNPRPNDPATFYLYDTRGDMYLRLGKQASALADFNKSLELGPFRWDTYKRRADAHFQLKNYDKALADIAKAVELKPEDTSNLVWILPQDAAACPDEGFRQGLLELADRTIELTNGAPGAYGVKGRLFGAFGREEEALDFIGRAFERLPEGTCRYELIEALGEVTHRKEAIPYLHKLAELQPESARFWYQAALAQLGPGLLDSYRTICRGMLRQFQDTETPADAYWVAWACALVPDATNDWPKAVALAEKAAKSDPKSFQYQNTLGAILYRAGRFEEALARLTEADRLVKEPSESQPSSPAYTWFFLAMAHHRLGHREEAKKWLDKAVAWTEKVFRDADQGKEGLAWTRRLTLKLLRAEAAELLGIPVKPPAGKEKGEKGK